MQNALDHKFIYINFQSWRDEDDKNDESSGPSWFRGHRWVRNPKSNGFRPHDFYFGNFRSRGTLLHSFSLSYQQIIVLFSTSIFRIHIFLMQSAYVINISVTRNILAGYDTCIMHKVNLIEFCCFLFREQVDLSFAQVMKMNRKRCFAMLSVGNRHFIGLLILMIFVGEITDVLIQKVPDVGVMRQMMRMKHPHRRRYLWHGRHLD